MNFTTVAEINRAREGKTLVFTNGVFDILHAGHVQYLKAARELGDTLVVGLNSDESVRSLNKGSDRPINPLNDRAVVIGALRAVDFVVCFEESTPEKLISELKPDIHVKGGDYKPDDLPETAIVEAYGGKVVILPFLPGRSSTSIIQKLTSLPEG